MEKYIFLFTMIMAIAFICSGKWITSTWIKKSVTIYGAMFFVVATVSGSLYITKNKTVISSAIHTLLPAEKEKTAPAKNELISQHQIKAKVQLKAPLIEQFPELPRGCEVTSLAMLLNFHDIPADKMKLAKEVEKDSSKYKTTDKGIHFGNPENGFVGDMYSFSNPGYGVYHRPIAVLASKYAKKQVNDLTGKSFSAIIDVLNQKKPVWVIINATYQKLPKSRFTTWHTDTGKVSITMKEHSVLITGYDDTYVYFNDPLNKTKKAPIKDFIAAWEQMGKQAIAL